MKWLKSFNWELLTLLLSLALFWSWVIWELKRHYTR